MTILERKGQYECLVGTSLSWNLLESLTWSASDSFVSIIIDPEIGDFSTRR